VEKVISKYEDKLLFYDSIVGYIKGLITKNKISYSIDEKDPTTIGNFIEFLLKKYIKTKRDYIALKIATKNI